MISFLHTALTRARTVEGRFYAQMGRNAAVADPPPTAVVKP